MPTEITETEHATLRLKRATLGGLKFRVPLSPTLAYMFWMRGFIKKFADQTLVDDDLVDCYDQTVEFLRQFNDKVDEQELQRRATLADLVNFYNSCYGADADETEEEDALPPRPRRGTSGANRSTRRSRS